MGEAAYKRAMMKQAKVARDRQGMFDALPEAVRDQLNEAPVKPDTAFVSGAYWAALPSMGEEEATAWIMRSIDAWVRQEVGFVAPLKPSRRRPAVKRHQTPDTHKLAPAIRSVVS